MKTYLGQTDAMDKNGALSLPVIIAIHPRGFQKSYKSYFLSKRRKSYSVFVVILGYNLMQV
jgi:hypothetical protein